MRAKQAEIFTFKGRRFLLVEAADNYGSRGGVFGLPDKDYPCRNFGAFFSRVSFQKYYAENGEAYSLGDGVMTIGFITDTPKAEGRS